MGTGSACLPQRLDLLISAALYAQLEEIARRHDCSVAEIAQQLISNAFPIETQDHQRKSPPA